MNTNQKVRNISFIRGLVFSSVSNRCQSIRCFNGQFSSASEVLAGVIIFNWHVISTAKHVDEPNVLNLNFVKAEIGKREPIFHYWMFVN